MNRVAGKKALVTGGAQGLGAGIARALAAEGAQVVVTDINDSGAAEVAASIGGTSIRHDVTSEADWIAAIDHARAAMSGLSILVNNAGIVTMGTVEELDFATWQRTMAINTDSVFLGCKYAMPLMRETIDGGGAGSIVNISSISALIAGHNLAAYNASKAAVWMLTKSVALHAARDGLDIRCNSIHPTFVKTPLLKGIIGDRDEAVTLGKLAKQVPLGRLGEVEDVAQAVLYLASDESKMMTGAELKLDGGLSAM